MLTRLYSERYVAMKIMKCIAAAAAAAIMLVFPADKCYARYDASAVGVSVQQPVYSAQSFDTVELAADYLSFEVKKHSAEIRISAPISFEQSENYLRSLFDAAFPETGRGSDGDYLRYSIKDLSCGMSGNNKKVTFTLKLLYHTTSSQESYVDKKVKEIEDSLELSKKNDYGKLYAIYDWIIKNVTYSQSTENTEVFSAYGALKNGNAVCQGFSQLFYRMAMDSGVSCRIIGGTAGNSSHAWLIAAVNGTYYFLDPTWDSAYKGQVRYYFLQGENDFDPSGAQMKHTMGTDGNDIYPDYNSSGFRKLYPISKTKYSSSDRPGSYELGDINGDGTIDGSDATMVLKAYGQLNSFGNCGMPALQRLASDVNSDGTVDGTDATIILKYFSFVLAGHKISFKDFLKM